LFARRPAAINSTRMRVMSDSDRRGTDRGQSTLYCSLLSEVKRGDMITAIPEGGCEKTECHNPHEKARHVGLGLKTS